MTTSHLAAWCSDYTRNMYSASTGFESLSAYRLSSLTCQGRSSKKVMSSFSYWQSWLTAEWFLQRPVVYQKDRWFVQMRPPPSPLWIFPIASICPWWMQKGLIQLYFTLSLKLPTSWLLINRASPVPSPHFDSIARLVQSLGWQRRLCV